MSPRDQPALYDRQSSSSASSMGKELRKVRFSDVKIREYNRIAGDHPEAIGVPISIGWEYVENSSKPLDDYEKHRPSKRKNLRLSSMTRKNLLLNVFQVDEKEIQEADNEVKRIRRQRESSNKQGKIAARLESALVGTKRRLTKTFFSKDELFHGFAVASGIPLGAY